MWTVQPVHSYLIPPPNAFSPSPRRPLSLPSTQFADVCNIPLLIIKEDHLREGNSSLLLQPLKVCNLAAWIDFPMSKVSDKAKELQQLVGPFYLTRPANECNAWN